MTSSNRNMFRVNGPLCQEFAGHRWTPPPPPLQRPARLNIAVYFDLCLNKRLSKQSRRWWFETPSRSLWYHCSYLSLTKVRTKTVICHGWLYKSKSDGHTMKYKHLKLVISRYIQLNCYINAFAFQYAAIFISKIRTVEMLTAVTQQTFGNHTILITRNVYVSCTDVSITDCPCNHTPTAPF